MSDKEAAEGNRPTILVVDDSSESLRFLTTTLTLAKMTVLAAKSGSAALALLKHASPDLILMDALMPAMDGFETTRQIKADAAHRHLPIIFMTGLTDTNDVVRALDEGAIDYVKKPIVVDELLARIRIHLVNARIAQASQLALDTSGRPVLSVDSAGNLHWLTPMAREIIDRLFSKEPLALDVLPLPIRLAIEHLAGIAPPAGSCLTIESGQSTLEATFLRRTSADHWLFRLAERREGEEERILAARFKLTSRESEVLLWISRGKQNREISAILGISPRTVNKHLEQIFEKMGVENRASATAIAVAALAD